MLGHRLKLCCQGKSQAEHIVNNGTLIQKQFKMYNSSSNNSITNQLGVDLTKILYKLNIFQLFIH